MNDFENQIKRVVDCIDPLLWHINLDSLSQTYGCAHLAYWRDKTSDIADARRQEAVFPLALLYTNEYPDSPYKGDKRLLAAAAAMLHFWATNQYPDGSMDEWYKGERAYAASAFSIHAVARTLMLLEKELPQEILNESREGLRRAASWLENRNDLVKTNHQGVGVAAMAFAGHVLSEPRFTKNAHRKLKSVLAVQHTEGWFPELSGMDPGYIFLTVEYIAMAMDLLNDWTGIDSLAKAYDFACQWLHPDMTLGTEYGICHNPYVSRIAPVLLSSHSELAAHIEKRLMNCSVQFPGYRSTLADDLRIPRWAFQPLLAWDYAQSNKNSRKKTPSELPLSPGSQTDTFFKTSALARLTGDNITAVTAGCAGGLVRLFGSNGTLAEHGFAIKTNDGFISNMTYDRSLPFSKTKNSIRMEAGLAPLKQFLPPYWARLTLRLCCSTAVTSRWTRMAIDIIRKRKNSAINQSSGTMSTNSEATLIRTFSLKGTDAVMHDSLSFSRPISMDAIYSISSQNDESAHKKPIGDIWDNLPLTAASLKLSRCYTHTDEGWILTSHSWETD